MRKDQSQQQASVESGFSLVEVFVAMLFLAMSAFVLREIVGTYWRVDQTARSLDSVRDLESGLRTYILRQIKGFATPSADFGFCSPDEFKEVAKDKKIGGWAMPVFVSSPFGVSTQAPQEQVDAAKRCSAPAQISDLSGSDFHYCLFLETDGHKGSTDDRRYAFTSAIRPFVEVRVRLIDMTSGANLTCSQFMTTPTAAAAVNYGIHWSQMNALANKLEFHAYVGWFYAGP